MSIIAISGIIPGKTGRKKVVDHFSRLDDDIKTGMLENMLVIRKCEETIDSLNRVKAFHGTNHLCIGQEASAVGLCGALTDDDWMIATHRGHGHYLARCSYDVKGLMAEMFGLKAGPCLGLGGSMHLSDKDRHYICSTGVVAGGVPIGVGMALNLKYMKKDGIAVSIFGDGASNQGMALESLNLAALWEVPMLFYCENNRYAVSSPSDRFVANTTVAARAEGCGVESITIDANDLPGVYNAMTDVRNRILETGKPFFVEAMTYRFNGHSRSDKIVYRTKEDEAPFRANDPVENYYAYLSDRGLISEETYLAMQKKAGKIAEDAVAFCRANTETITAEDAEKLVYSSEVIG